VVCVGAWLIEGEREVLSRLQRAGVPGPVVGSGGVGSLSFVNPRNRRPRSNGELTGIKEEILDRNRHIILCRGGGNRDQHGCHREYGQIQ
jgi:hypothetical protein